MLLFLFLFQLLLQLLLLLKISCFQDKLKQHQVICFLQLLPTKLSHFEYFWQSYKPHQDFQWWGNKRSSWLLSWSPRLLVRACRTLSWCFGVWNRTTSSCPRLLLLLPRVCGCLSSRCKARGFQGGFPRHQWSGYCLVSWFQFLQLQSKFQLTFLYKRSLDLLPPPLLLNFPKVPLKFLPYTLFLQQAIFHLLSPN